MLFEKIELESNEEVLKVVRRHWFIIVTRLLGTLFLIVFPVFVLLIIFLIPDLLPASFTLQNHLSLITFFSAFWLLFSLLSGFMVWTGYYLDLWIITDRRIIAIDQIQFFNRKVSSFRLERLQDISVSINGFIPTFLNFGNLVAHTASEEETSFTTTGLPEPREIQSLIQKAVDARLEAIHGTGGRIIND